MTEKEFYCLIKKGFQNNDVIYFLKHKINYHEANKKRLICGHVPVWFSRL